ncbi:MAG TPA: DUF5985 family protein [Longimicrobiaceae bacterium]|nr:DUF5985 family protein [Longimicrobiaceae bacterium]
MRELLSGAMVMGYLVPGLFFFRFWKESADRLFLIFAVAFWMLAVQRTLLTLLAEEPGAHIYLYVVRLLAFLLIIAAIVDKNRATRT